MFAPTRSWSPASMAQKLQRGHAPKDSTRKRPVPATPGRPSPFEPSTPYQAIEGVVEHGDDPSHLPSPEISASNPRHAPRPNRPSASRQDREQTSRPALQSTGTGAQVTFSHANRTLTKIHEESMGIAGRQFNKSKGVRRRKRTRSATTGQGQETSERNKSPRGKRSKPNGHPSPRDGRVDRTRALADLQRDDHSSRPRGDAETSASTAQIDSVVCDWCFHGFSHVSRHYCRDCPFNLCAVCIGNASTIYAMHDGTHRCEEIPPGARPRSEEREAVRPSHETTGCPTCALCGVKLLDIQYQCQQCPDFYLCEDDHKFHDAGHTMAPTNHRTVATSPRTGARNHDAQHDSEARSTMGTALLRRPAEEGAWTDTEDDTDGHDELEEDELESREEAGSHEQDEWGEDADTDCNSVGHGRADTHHPRTRRPRPRSQVTEVPTQVTLTLPMEGYIVFKSWAEAILAQSPIPAQSPMIAKSPRNPPRIRGNAQGSRSRQPWLSKDQKQLRILKEQGRTDQEIAHILGRSPGAVAQQWKKQK